MNIIKEDLRLGSMSYNNSPDTIILHHAEASSCTVQDINRWHKDRGWAGIGYQYYVRKNGAVYKGRLDNAQGAHCPGFNTHSIGICAEGAYGREQMPEVQKNTIIQLCKELIVKYPAIKHIYGHREVYSTDCPGRNYPLSEIRNKVFNTSTPIIEQQQSTNRSWLQVGDTGSQVTEVQNALNRLGFNCGKADGIYGKGTKNAVYNFQQAINLQADGLAGVETIKALREIISKPLDRVRAPHYEYATRYIQYRVGANIDGTFGRGTEQKVALWQKQNGLVPDGQVGSSSWAKLIK